jgi:serine/threonine protein kinase
MSHFSVSPEIYQRPSTSSNQRPRISDVPLDDHYEPLDRPVLNRGFFNAGVQLFRRVRDGVIVVRKKFELTRDARSVSAHWYREMTIMRDLVHPNIVEFIDGYVTDIRACLYMEVCDLGSLGSLVKEYKRNWQKLPTRFVWHVMWSVANALTYCHTGFNRHDDGLAPEWIPVFHRDVHADNVFLKSAPGDYPQVKLGDFGCGVGHEELDCWTGNQNHWGPRILGPPWSCGEGNDVFSLGAMIQMMCHPEWREPRPNAGVAVEDGWPLAIDYMVRFMMKWPYSEPPPAQVVVRKMEDLAPEILLKQKRPVNPQAFHRIM